jgi:hypothetical protein
MKLLIAESPLIGTKYWLELPDGRCMNYNVFDASLNPEQVRQEAFAVARQEIGVAQANPDHVSLRYGKPPKIATGSWQDDCFAQAKEDALFRDLVKPEYVAAFAEALTLDHWTQYTKP